MEWRKYPIVLVSASKLDQWLQEPIRNKLNTGLVLARVTHPLHRAL